MDKQTSEKLNDTLEKMGAVGEGHSSSTDSAQSSDMSFYVIMLALIVAMGFYISYDSSQRYGSGTSSSADSSLTGSAQEQSIEPVIISIEKVKTVEVVPIAVIEATESTAEAVVVEKVEQKTVVTTAVIPVEDVVKTEAAAVTEKAESEAPAVAIPASAASMIPAMDIMMQAAKDATTPVVEAVEKIVEKTETAVTETVAEPVIPMPVMPTPQPEQAYNNPYGYQYGQPQNNYYQQQPQYGNPSGNQYGNPSGNQYGNQYGNPYGNQYGNPYGYGNNPYQQRAAQPGQ